MHPRYQCVHCGQAVDAPLGPVGGPVRCAACGREFVPAGTPAPPRRPPSRDDTLSRSMLLPIPMAATGPPGEMLCRLEPGTLRHMLVSDALANFLGDSTDPVIGRSFLDSLHPDDRALAEDEFRQAAEQGERHDFVLRIRDRDGQWHYMRIYTQARYTADGRLNHIRCNLKDVTDRVRAEQELRRRTEQLTAANEQLRKANEKLKDAQVQLVHTEKLASLGTLAAGMAHEINNPLAFSSNNVAALERDVATLLEIIAGYQEGRDALRATRPELADRIAHLEAEADLPYLRGNLGPLIRSTRRGLSRVAQIVQNLRDFAQLDRAEVGKVDVNRSIEQGLGLLGDLLARQRIGVERRFEALPPLEGAVAGLNQAFLNILMNGMQAIEATGRGSGRLTVATRDGGHEVVVEVADDGVGIAPEALPRIFDPFFTTRPAGRGSGLGLSFSHGIIAEHGGRIEVESAVGVGSTFRVRLPARRAGRAAP